MSNCRKCGAKLVRKENWYPSCAAKGDRICIECHKAYNRQWGREHSKEIAARVRRHRKEHLEESRASDRQYRQEHRKEIQARQRRWAAKNREQEYARRLQWIEDNPGKSREQSHRRRARLANATIGPVDEQKIYALYDNVCLYCGSEEDLTLDHVVALNKGGAHCEDNLVVACRRCNGGKCDKLLEEWLQIQPYSRAWLF